MPSISRILKSAVFGALALFLCYLGMSYLANLPFPEDGEPLRATSQLGFELTFWSWVVLSCWSGILLGMMHAPAGHERFSRFVGDVKLLTAVWAAFAASNMLMALVATPYGAGYFIAASVLVCAALGLTALSLSRARAAGELVQTGAAAA